MERIVSWPSMVEVEVAPTPAAAVCSVEWGGGHAARTNPELLASRDKWLVRIWTCPPPVDFN